MIDHDTYRLLNEGLALYHRAEFFEAHEVWEDAWNGEVGRAKLTLQALIQIAAGLYKHQSGNIRGTCKLLAKASTKIDTITEGCSAWLGIDLVQLKRDVEIALAAADEIARGTPTPIVTPPLPTTSGPTGVIYLHGFASSPRSKKAAMIVPALEARGLHVAVPDLNADDFEHLTVTRALAQAKRLMREHTLVIGSSFGGYLAALLAAKDDRVKGLVLMAPAFEFGARLRLRYGDEAIAAWKTRGSIAVDHYAYADPMRLSFGIFEDAASHPGRPVIRVPTYILQGRRDDVVPATMVQTVAAEAKGPIEFDLVDDDHALANSASRARDASLRMAEQLHLLDASP